jgi:hypothetical protein
MADSIGTHSVPEFKFRGAKDVELKLYGGLLTGRFYFKSLDAQRQPKTH